MSGIRASAAELRDLAARCRASAQVVALAAGDAATAVTRTVGCVVWDGPAATSHGRAAARLTDRAGELVLLVGRAADALDEVADSSARTTAVLRDLEVEAASAAAAGDTAQLVAVEDRARAAEAAHRAAERAAATSLAAVTGALPRDWGEPLLLGLSPSQWRDAVRGIGEVAWEAGPESATFALRWMSVPGWLGLWDPVDAAENDAKAWLQAWGGGNDGGPAYWGVYGAGTAAAAFLPGPFGKPGAADNAGRLAGAGSQALRGGDEIVRSPDEWRRLADEAGEWRGDAGLVLSPRQNRDVILFHADSAAAERSITPRLLEISQRMGVPMAGLEFRLKSLESLQRKVATEMFEHGQGAPVAPALDDLKDAVRYTYTSSDAMFVDDVTVVAAQLESAGFERIKWQLSWSDDSYHGLNTAWRDPVSGQTFEVQFHTPGSLWMKEYTHPLYEEGRLPTTTSDRMTAIETEGAVLNRQVTRPPGLEQLVQPPSRR